MSALRAAANVTAGPVLAGGDQVFLVRGQRVRRADLHGWDAQVLLRDEHGGDRKVLCLCRDPGVAMVLRVRGAGYSVDRMPKRGHEHAISCLSFTDPRVEGGRSVYGAGCIETLEDGSLLVRLRRPGGDDPIAAGQPAPPAATAGRVSVSAGAMTPLGLVYLVWERAELNRWYPGWAGKRSWATVRRRLLEAANDVRLRGETRSLDEMLVLPERLDVARKHAQQAAVEQRVAQLSGFGPHGRRRDALVMVEVKSLRPWQDRGAWLKARHLPDLGFWVPADELERAYRRFPRVFPVLDRQDSGRFVALLGCRPGRKGGVIEVRSVSVVRTSPDWIPVESDPEAVLCERLVDEGREFVKPLRFDAGDDVVFPDFVLLDAGDEPVPLEVYGYSGERYERRKADKIAFYREVQGTEPWHWDVPADPTGPPVLPRRVAR